MFEDELNLDDMSIPNGPIGESSATPANADSEAGVAIDEFGLPQLPA